MREVRDGNLFRDSRRYCGESYGENYAFDFNKISNFVILVWSPIVI